MNDVAAARATPAANGLDATDATWARLGGELAALHRTPGPAFGMAADNFIGSLPRLSRRRRRSRRSEARAVVTRPW